MAAKEDFIILETVGSGQFGICKKIKKKSDGHVFCWKEIDYGAMNVDDKRLLCQEVNLLRDLRHESIVRYYDRIIDKRTCTLYLIMEWCEGGDLNAMIQRHKSRKQYINEEFIWQVLFQVLSALKECGTSRKGRVKVIHRDLKPANIFLDKNNKVKVGDFGLARIFQHNTSLATSYVGTPYYMAPEVMKGHPYDEKSDLWSLGCVAYELCALSPPFLASNQHALATKVASGKLKDIPELYSSELDAVIKKLLNVNPVLRPDAEVLLKATHSLCVLVKEKELAELDKKLSKWHKQLLKKEMELEQREHKLQRTMDGCLAPRERVRDENHGSP